MEVIAVTVTLLAVGTGVAVAGSGLGVAAGRVASTVLVGSSAVGVGGGVLHPTRLAEISATIRTRTNDTARMDAQPLLCLPNRAELPYAMHHTIAGPPALSSVIPSVARNPSETTRDSSVACFLGMTNSLASVMLRAVAASPVEAEGIVYEVLLEEQLNHRHDHSGLDHRQIECQGVVGHFGNTPLIVFAWFEQFDLASIME